MDDTILQPIISIWDVPTIKPSSIYQFDFNGHECIATFDNGFPWEFSSTRLLLINGLSAEYKTRFTATNPASTSFQLQDDNNVWGSTLRGVGVANFNGPWNYKLLGYYLSKMPELDILSCTYWSCYDIAYVIKQTSSIKLREISLHVGATQGMDVVRSIAALGLPELSRVLLVFASQYSKKKADLFIDELKRGLTENATVTLLFSSEGECIKKLESEHNFNIHCTMKVAANQLVRDEDAKQFEEYEVYRAQVDDMTVMIGSKIGSFVTPVVMPKYQSEEKLFSNENKIELVKSVVEPPHYHPPKIIIPSWEYQSRKNMDKYATINVIKGELSCCARTTAAIPELFPTWDTTKIQLVIYKDYHTEFFTTSGLYVQVTKMQDEVSLFKNVPATHRLVVHCTSHLRLNIIDENLVEFLANVRHIEFKGDWDSTVLGKIAANLTPKTTALTLIQISFQPGGPIRQILDCIHGDVLNGILRFHYDARDSYDRHFNSVYLGMKDKFMEGKIEELVVVAGKFGEGKFAANLNKLYHDLCGLVVGEGSITIVVTDQEIPPSEIKDEGFEGEAYVTLVPLAYQQSSKFGPSRMRAMLGLYSQRYGRERYLVMKWSDILMMKHFPGMQKFDREKFDGPRYN